MTFRVPERFRARIAGLRNDASLGNNGMFFVPNPKARSGPPLKVIASDGVVVPEPAVAGWEHVSVSLPHRCPTWDEMCYVKALFWEPRDAVVQIHPPESEYVNSHPYCLHLWRPVGGEFPRPPSVLVGHRYGETG